MMPVTRPLARYVAQARYEDFPPAVRHAGTRAFVNWLGCVLGGCREDVSDRAIAAYGAFAGPPQATVIGRPLRFDAPTAALLNTMANFAHGYNDTHLATVAHPTGAAASAAFAQSEREPVSGKAFSEALILGAEVACRMAALIAAPPARSHVGLSTHGLSNVFGAAVATGKLLGLDEDRMVWALGLACMQAAGLRSAYGTMGTKLIAGHAARCGMMAAYLAQAGFTCSETPIEDPKGFAAVFADPSNPAAATEGLGQRFELLEVAYKPYPCGVVIFPAIDACLQLAATAGFQAAAARQIDLWVHPLVLQLCNRPEPRDRIQALTSLQHWAAVSLQHRAAGLKQGTDDSVRDALTQRLRGCMTVMADPALSASAAAVEVVMDNGSRLTASVSDYQGSLQQPMTDQGLGEKFVNQALLVMPQASAQALLAEAWTLDRMEDVGALASRHLLLEY